MQHTAQNKWARDCTDRPHKHPAGHVSLLSGRLAVDERNLGEPHKRARCRREEQRCREQLTIASGRYQKRQGCEVREAAGQYQNAPLARVRQDAERRLDGPGQGSADR